MFDSAGMLAFFALAAWAGMRLLAHPQSEAWIVVVAMASGWLAADLLSGLVHWGFDTWGSIHTPMIGSRFIRPFRAHHFDPLAMTQHDFVEIAGSSCLAALPVLGLACWLPLHGAGALLLQGILLFTALGVLLTNQCHKWAHLSPEALPAPVRMAQRLRLILRRADHLRHHVRPFDSHYCTASGWLNRPLHAI